MKKYNVKVNGKPYVVEIEEASGSTVSGAGYEPAYEPVPTVQYSETENVSTYEGSVVVTCPMPGTILKIEKNIGEQVRAGEVLIILEAMKMENEIMAPQDGVITQISVTEGASVNTGDVLLVM